jgi:hypothetical protein
MNVDRRPLSKVGAPSWKSRSMLSDFEVFVDGRITFGDVNFA